MSITCTRCDGTGFLNSHQIPGSILKNSSDFQAAILEWMQSNEGHDVMICDCCGDGEGWYGVPGEHYNHEDPRGEDGPYAYNGGLCECN